MVFVIAEAGINHNGDIQEAMRLVVAAKRCGADAVKFQHFNSQRLWGDDRIAKYELTVKQLTMLKEHADSLGIEFMCTAFDCQSLEEIMPLIKRIKISSGCIVDPVLLEDANQAGKPVIISTGMSRAEDVEQALCYFTYPEDDVTLLQCTSVYPCPPDQVNLYVMRELAWTHCTDVGFSDHTTGINCAIAAAALGATVIEKHLTLDCFAEGPDHKASIEPWQFTQMVWGIREVEQALGDGIKRVQPGEQALREIWHARK